MRGFTMLSNRYSKSAILIVAALASVTCRKSGTPSGDSPPAASMTVPSASTSPIASPPSPKRAGGSTPGKISCGGTLCDLTTQVCCADFVGDGQRCVQRPSDQSQAPCGDKALTKYCDGAEDCPGGACCNTAACTGGCPPLHACESPRCESEPGGVCSPGGACPAGFECLTAERSKQGSCVLSNPGVTCGDKRCEGDTPLCCWNVKTKQGQCADSCPGEGMDGVARLACANNADCAGYACGRFSSSPAQSFACAGHSFAGDRFEPILCASLADCPKHFGLIAQSCKSPGDGSLPPNVKVCGYE